MNINIKTEDEINILKQGGKILTEIVNEMSKMLFPGTKTMDIEKKGLALCEKMNVKPAFLGYKGYPAGLCIGINDDVVHGIPSEGQIIEEGDIVSLDYGIIYKGFYSDKAYTFPIGKIEPDTKKFLKVSENALNNAINVVKEGATLGDIGFEIENTVSKEGYSVVKEMVGHGIGKKLHEEPFIPGYGNKGEGIVLKKGMVLAIEAIINQKNPEIVFLDDGWTTKTRDGALSAIFEHSVVVTKVGYEILTI